MTIVDNDGLPVAGTTVDGDFNGDFTSHASSLTNDLGIVQLQTETTAKGNTSFGFCVTSVTHDTLNYEPVANIETCDQF